jgi:hypothetical protein
LFVVNLKFDTLLYRLFGEKTARGYNRAYLAVKIFFGKAVLKVPRDFENPENVDFENGRSVHGRFPAE